jgi:NAD dependent epimerase/dehydratase family enzyme
VKNAELLNDADIVINMVGENVGEFWSEEKKQRITRSRMAGTALIVKKISELKKKPKLFISASGLSYYGYLKSEQVFDENDTVTDEPGIGCILTYCFILITIPPFIHSRCILVL